MGLAFYDLMIFLLSFDKLTLRLSNPFSYIVSHRCFVIRLQGVFKWVLPRLNRFTKTLYLLGTGYYGTFCKVILRQFKWNEKENWN